MTNGVERNVRETSFEVWLQDVENSWKNPPEFKIDTKKLVHLAIICDGNRRGARARGLPDYLGHRVGIETIKGIARASRDWGLKTLTFWVWSTENWQRDKEQVEFVMYLAQSFLSDKELVDELVGKQVRFRHLGRKDRIPKGVKDAIDELEEKTAQFGKYTLNLALDYGGMDEIARAWERMHELAVIDPTFFKKVIEDPKIIYNFLDTAGQEPPDMIIRTGMEKGEVLRTSGFMPLQTAYSGFFPVEEYFPDVKPMQLIEKIQRFQEYEMRKGR